MNKKIENQGQSKKFMIKKLILISIFLNVITWSLSAMEMSSDKRYDEFLARCVVTKKEEEILSDIMDKITHSDKVHLQKVISEVHREKFDDELGFPRRIKTQEENRLRFTKLLGFFNFYQEKYRTTVDDRVYGIGERFLVKKICSACDNLSKEYHGDFKYFIRYLEMLYKKIRFKEYIGHRMEDAINTLKKCNRNFILRYFSSMKIQPSNKRKAGD